MGRGILLVRVLTFCVLTGLVICSNPARAGFVIENLVYRSEPSQLVVNISTRLALNDTIEDALRRGIDLQFDLELSLQRHRLLIWNEQISKHAENIILRYHALSNRYLILDENQEQLSSFTDINQALEHFDELGPYTIMLPAKFEPRANAAYYIAARIRLNIEALPLPLRPSAYLSSNWRLNSTWILWQVQI